MALHALARTPPKKTSQQCAEIGNITHAGGMETELPLWQKVWQVFKELIMEASYDPEILLLQIYTKELTPYVQTKICT